MSTLGNNLLAQYYAQNQYGLWIPERLGYVTDGLVAMWDGEYNTGNRHDPNAASWKDCVGGVVLPYIGYETYEWLDKCCHFLGTSGYGAFIVDKALSGVRTLESVMSWETLIGTGNYPIPAVRTSTGDAFLYIGSNGGLTGNVLPVSQNGIYRRGFSNSCPKNTVKTYTMCVMDGSVYPTMYIDSVGASSSFTTSNNQRQTSIYIGSSHDSTADGVTGGAARRYCIRAYNRVLSLSEVAQNYAVDVARFGTTYQP